MDRRFEVGWLNDFYGPLLTKNRQEALRLYLEEDMSLGEIAEETGISRQGVHDALHKAEEQLDNYEAKLGLLDRYRKIQAAVDDCRAALERVVPERGSREALAQAAAALERIEKIER
ncbi:MAG: sigma factor-like helix-turn-helix DNA-binding protein [Clostridia bacterium]